MIEIRIRVLLKSDKGMSVVPSTTLVAKKAPTSLDVAKVVEGLMADLSVPLLGNLRPMTEEEADAYRAKEEAEADECCSDLGLGGADLEEARQ